MTAIHTVPSDHKMIWRGGDFTKEDIAFDLTARHRAALEDVLHRVAGTEITEGKIDHSRYVEVATRLTERFKFKQVAITLRESFSARRSSATSASSSGNGL